LKRKATLKKAMELSVQEDGNLLKQEEGKDDYEDSFELGGQQQFLDGSLVAADHELHP
jgi:hypothetical protein